MPKILTVRLSYADNQKAIISLQSRVGQTRGDATVNIPIGKQVDLKMPEALFEGGENEAMTAEQWAMENDEVTQLKAKNKELKKERETYYSQHTGLDSVQLKSLQEENDVYRRKAKTSDRFEKLGREIYEARLHELSADDLENEHGRYETKEGSNKKERHAALMDTYDNSDADTKLKMIDSAKAAKSTDHDKTRSDSTGNKKDSVSESQNKSEGKSEKNEGDVNPTLQPLKQTSQKPHTVSDQKEDKSKNEKAHKAESATESKEKEEKKAEDNHESKDAGLANSKSFGNVTKDSADAKDSKAQKPKEATDKKKK